MTNTVNQLPPVVPRGFIWWLRIIAAENKKSKELKYSDKKQKAK